MTTRGRICVHARSRGENSSRSGTFGHQDRAPKRIFPATDLSPGRQMPRDLVQGECPFEDFSDRGRTAPLYPHIGDTLTLWIFRSFWSLTLPHGGFGCVPNTPSHKACGWCSPRRARRIRQRSATKRRSTRLSASAGSMVSLDVETTQHSGDGSHPETLGALGLNGTSPSPRGCKHPAGCISRGKRRFGRRRRTVVGRPPTPDRPVRKSQMTSRKP